MEKVTVRLGSYGKRGYDILVGEGLIRDLGKQVTRLGAKRAFLIADARLAAPTRAAARALGAAGIDVTTARLPAREQTKDFLKAFPLFGKMLECGLDRHGVVVALGGGVIGDLAGFVAGTYLRGIRWVGVPTTLLAQVDSSIGGKTGVNHPLGKNLVGVFHQPSLVVCDTGLLRTLARRDRVSGFAEIVKYGLAFDARFFAYLVRHRDAILSLEQRHIAHAVAESARWKAHVVARDERETLGLRRLLNFGHTLGHALEAAAGYSHFRHGEAIVWGMRWAAALSVVRGHLRQAAWEAIDSFLGGLEVPKIPLSVTLEKLFAYVKRDKKARDGKIPFILLSRIGKTVVDAGVDELDLVAAITLVEETVTLAEGSR